MIPCAQSRDDLLADIRDAGGGEDQCHIWWFGQSGFLLKWLDHHLLFDPYLSDSLTTKYADTDKPHVRMTERCLDPADLAFPGLVATSSHNHTDHLDADTLVPLRGAVGDLKLVLPAANIDFAQRRLAAAPPQFVGLNDGEGKRVGPWNVFGVAAAHNELERDQQGRCLHLGFVVEFGPFAVYHSGDTLWHPHLVDQLNDFDLDLVMVPINGNEPGRRVAGNLNGTEAAAVARAVNAGIAVPHHFEMFEFNTASPDEFAAVCARLGQPCRVLRCGERLGLGG